MRVEVKKQREERPIGLTFRSASLRAEIDAYWAAGIRLFLFDSLLLRLLPVELLGELMATRCVTNTYTTHLTLSLLLDIVV